MDVSVYPERGSIIYCHVPGLLFYRNSHISLAEQELVPFLSSVLTRYHTHQRMQLYLLGIACIDSRDTT